MKKVIIYALLLSKGKTKLLEEWVREELYLVCWKMKKAAMFSLLLHITLCIKSTHLKTQTDIESFITYFLFAYSFTLSLFRLLYFILFLREDHDDDTFFFVCQWTSLFPCEYACMCMHTQLFTDEKNENKKYPLVSFNIPTKKWPYADVCKRVQKKVRQDRYSASLLLYQTR